MIAEPAKPLKIGSLELPNPLLLAPLSGISDLPFRLLAKEQGCALVCTEMISAEGLRRRHPGTIRLLTSHPDERPLAVQIFGSRPASMSEAARIVEDYGVDVLDINMGCPMRKVVRGGSGAALLRDVTRVKEMIQAVRRAISVPLTVKIRSGWDEKSINFLEVARMAEECGINALTIHGRTRAQGYGVKADWQVIARAKSQLSIPVIGNGDLTSPQGVMNMLSQTGCDGTMIGRGALGNPWIFSQALQMLQGQLPKGPSLQGRETMILRHFKMIVEIRGETRGLREFRKHLIWYTRGLPGSADFRSRIPSWVTFPEVVEHIEEYFQNLRKKQCLDKDLASPKP